MDLNEIDWARMPRPQADGYDTRTVATLAKERYGFQPKDEFVQDFEGPAMFEGTVPLLHFQPWIAERFENAPFDYPVIARGEALLKECWPEQYEQCKALLTSVWPMLDVSQPADGTDRGAGCTCGPTALFGGISSTVMGAVGFAEGIVHELGHWKLHAMGVHLEDWDDQLVGNALDERFESPIRKDMPRPMGACIQAQYSYLHVLELNIRVTKAGHVAAMLELNRDRMAAGRETLKAWKPGKAGDAFMKAMDAWTVEILEDATALLARS